MSQYEPMYDSFRRTPNEGYIPSARMSVSASVYLPGSEVDLYTGQLKPDHQRRRRTQAKRLERERLEREDKRQQEAYAREMSKGGVRVTMRAGVLLMAAVLFVCGLVLLYQQGQIANRQKEINRIERAAEECRKTNEALSAELARLTNSSDICYAASNRLNMIPSSAVQAIHLNAVDTRPLETAQAAQQSALAAAQPSQNTSVSANAGN